MIQVGIDALRSLIRFGNDERAQDIFEYVLIIGIITVAVLVAVATPIGGKLIEAVIEGTCKAIGAASDAANGTSGGAMISVDECNALIT